MRLVKGTWAAVFTAGLLSIAMAPTASGSVQIGQLGFTDFTGYVYVNLFADGTTTFSTLGCGGTEVCNAGTDAGTVAPGFNQLSVGGLAQVGGWDLSLNLLGTSYPPNGNASGWLEDLAVTADYHGGGSNQLTVFWASNGFNSSIPGFDLKDAANTSGIAPGTTYWAGVNPGTGLLSFPYTGIGSIGANSSGSFADPTCSGNPCSTASLAEQINYTASGSSATISDDFKLSAVPEPTSILLLGGAMALAGRALRRKFATK